MTNINHTGHAHPNTAAARTACRRALVDGVSTVMQVSSDGMYRTVMTPAVAAFVAGNYSTSAPVEGYSGIAILADHCQQCGSTDEEDIETGDDPDYQGYTRCCNERVIMPPESCTDTHCSH